MAMLRLEARSIEADWPLGERQFAVWTPSAPRRMVPGMVRPPLKVLITVDTEIWPRCPDWKQERLKGDIDRDINGATPSGRYGVGYQVEKLKHFGLTGVFFIETLFAEEVGIEPLAEIVRTVQDAGQEVQLHAHTEWLRWMSTPFRGLAWAPNIKDYSEDDQYELLSRGLANLKAAGANDVCAFRAGNYGANVNTLKALARCGIRYDSSYNFPYLASDCGLKEISPRLLAQAREVEGLIEVPVTCFSDLPGHYRHAQLCAVTEAEMFAAMGRAYDQGWDTFVIVSHCFELLKHRKTPRPFAWPDETVIRRFENLCRFLSDNKARFRTVGFGDLGELTLSDAQPLGFGGPATVVRTAQRVLSQALRRVVG